MSAPKVTIADLADDDLLVWPDFTMMPHVADLISKICREMDVGKRVDHAVSMHDIEVGFLLPLTVLLFTCFDEMYCESSSQQAESFFRTRIIRYR